MKKLALIALAAGASALAPQSASAQVVVHPGFGHGGGFHHGGFGGGNFFGGFAFGGFFHQPQFHVQNWQLYGFIQPRQDQRWVRYYDDAYLVDRRGYIFDRRERVDWDRYGERWDRDERGIPYYVGDGDYYPDRRDYRRVESERRYGSGWDYSGYGSACGRQSPCDGGGYHRGYEDRGYERRESYGRGYSGGYAPAPHPGNCAGYSCGGSAGYGHGGYGYGGHGTATGYGYGHGYGGGGTVIVTETTVTPGQVVTEEIIEEVVEEQAAHRRRAAPAPRRHYAPPPRRHYAPPPPRRVIQPRGDRG